MIKEKMLELLVLGFCIKNIDTTRYDITTETVKGTNGIIYDVKKMIKRTETLMDEFLEPYVIDSTSKE